MGSGDLRRARFTDLFGAHYGSVRAYAVRRVGPHDGDDVAEEVFMVAWRRLAEIPPQRERAWLIGCARNVLLDRARGERRRVAREEKADRGRAHVVSDPAEGVVESAVVAQALAALAEADRELLTLVAWDDLPVAEAGRVLGISPGAARVRLLRARRRFRQEYERVGGVAEGVVDGAMAGLAPEEA